MENSITQEPIDQPIQIGYKLYSDKAILALTYLGSPILAGILLQSNYKKLGKDKLAARAIPIGIAATIIIFAIIFSVPENVIEAIPNAVIPGTYTLATYFIMNSTIGEELANHKLQEGEFQSRLHVIGIGLIALIVTVGLFFIILTTSGGKLSDLVQTMPQASVEQYDSFLEKFGNNEDEGLEVYQYLENDNSVGAAYYIKTTTIPAFEKNLTLIEQSNQIEGLHAELIEQNNMLRTYCELSIEKFELIRKALENETNIYDPRIFELDSQINELLGN